MRTPAAPLRVLLVDDEAPARSRLRRLLAAFADVEVVGEAASAAGALAAVATLAPDLLLLDIQMPDASGLDVAASLPDPAPALVFVSAHGHYALPAFDAAALDYLLKPVEPDRLARALARVRERVDPHASAREGASAAAPRDRARSAARGTEAPRPATPARPEQLLVPDRGGRTHVVRLGEILWLEAADNYVVLHTATRAPLLRRPLAALLADLGPGFVRTHRSAAVALAQVEAVLPREGGEAEVLLRGGARAPCSRTRRRALHDALQAAAGRPS